MFLIFHLKCKFFIDIHYHDTSLLEIRDIVFQLGCKYTFFNILYYCIYPICSFQLFKYFFSGLRSYSSMPMSLIQLSISVPILLEISQPISICLLESVSTLHSRNDRKLLKAHSQKLTYGKQFALPQSFMEWIVYIAGHLVLFFAAGCYLFQLLLIASFVINKFCNR